MIEMFLILFELLNLIMSGERSGSIGNERYQ